MGHANSTLPSCICLVKRLKKLTQSTRDKSQWIAAQRLLSAHTIPGIIWIVCPGIRDHHKSTMGTCPACVLALGTNDKEVTPSIYARVANGHKKYSITSMDSDLEAFSHTPSDCSFAALACPLTAFASCLNKLFLSY